MGPGLELVGVDARLFYGARGGRYCGCVGFALEAIAIGVGVGRKGRGRIPKSELELPVQQDISRHQCVLLTTSVRSLSDEW